MNYKIIRVDVDTGQAIIAKTMDNTTETVAKERVAAFNRIAKRIPKANSWAFFYVEDRPKV